MNTDISYEDLLVPYLEGSADSPLEPLVVEALRSVFDPEIPVSVFDLGLIYDLRFSGDGVVKVIMTLTAPTCPVAEEIPEIRKRVRSFLLQMLERFPDAPIKVMTPLAEGADRLVAHEARALGLPLVVPLPMPHEMYLEDFSSPELAGELHLSRSQVYRKIKALTDMSTAIYIRHIRLQKAKELLASTELSICC